MPRGQKLEITAQQWAKIDALKEDGKKLPEIAEEMGISLSALGRAMREAGRGIRGPRGSYKSDGTNGKPAKRLMDGAAHSKPGSNGGGGGIEAAIASLTEQVQAYREKADQLERIIQDITALRDGGYQLPETLR